MRKVQAGETANRMDRIEPVLFWRKTTAEDDWDCSSASRPRFHSAALAITESSIHTTQVGLDMRVRGWAGMCTVGGEATGLLCDGGDGVVGGGGALVQAVHRGVD